MECRDARPLIRLAALNESERQRLDAHLLTCSACRDEAEDPLAAVWPAPRSAVPPADLTRHIMRRLPTASPLAIAARHNRTTRLIHGGAVAAFGLAAVMALAGIAGLQWGSARAADLVGGIALPVALVAKALLSALAQPWIAIGLATVTVALPLLIARISGSRAFPAGYVGRPTVAGGALLAALVLLNAGAHRGDQGVFAASLAVTQPVAGDVSSLAGDVIVGADVLGDVIALTGRVIIQENAHVHGSVMAGVGAIAHADGSVDQAVIETSNLLPALSRAAGSQTVTGASSSMATRVAGIVTALMTLLAGILLVLIWPQTPAEGGLLLLRFPGRAFVLGLFATVALLVLALGGTVLLAATVVGVLFVPILLALLHLPYAVGVAAVGHTLGRWVLGGPARSSAIWGIAAQLLVVVALDLVAPMLSLGLFYLLGTLGLGATLLVSHTRQLDTVL